MHRSTANYNSSPQRGRRQIKTFKKAVNNGQPCKKARGSNYTKSQEAVQNTNISPLNVAPWRRAGSLLQPVSAGGGPHWQGLHKESGNTRINHISSRRGSQSQSVRLHAHEKNNLLREIRLQRKEIALHKLKASNGRFFALLCGHSATSPSLRSG